MPVAPHAIFSRLRDLQSGQYQPSTRRSSLPPHRHVSRPRMLIAVHSRLFRPGQLHGVATSSRMAETEDSGAAETPFMMAYGTDIWGMFGSDAELGAGFNEAMQSDSRFVAGIVVRECGEVFAGIRSLVDVGGGDGTMAKAIAEAFPHVRCSVLELPQVVDNGVPADDDGKFILHDWSDEDCVKILKRCKEAISAWGSKGKVIIIDMVIGSAASKQTFESQLVMDLAMMVLVTGKERERTSEND
ncbi:hypothetical protein EJB05_02615, partial [Eragrostis curvula]